ncbi:MAG TPA: DUF1254 domain-containing protein [Pirellulales bacterium]|jgi:hypothetical protein|nr:DUF1254 domain-containing protein [Pirellulales bacterium]
MTMRISTLSGVPVAIATILLFGCGQPNSTARQAADSTARSGSDPDSAGQTTGGNPTDAAPAGIVAAKDIAREGYIYGFPMIAAYKAMYQFNVDRDSPQYKGPFNHVLSSAKLFTPKDTAIVAPNSDTPYSMLAADLRAEPLVLSVPAVDKDRYYSVQLTDMYACNYGYIGSRATGNAPGRYLVAGPDWKGELPAGVDKLFRCETQFSFIIYRTQLFDAADVENVKRIQAGYEAQPLSAFLDQLPPAPLPAPDFPKFTENAFKTDFPLYLDFLLQFCPPVPEERELRARLARIGIGPGKAFDYHDLSLEQKAEVAIGAREAFDSIEKRRDQLGKAVNGWRVGSAFGDRAFYHGDYLLRAAAALAGIFGNDAAEAVYPMARTDGNGQPLDGSLHKYTLTFAAGKLPPVNAFWSVTMYDGKTQLLIENPIDRYPSNSPMLPNLKKNADGSLTIYIQRDSPGPERQSNWLPAPDGPI